VELLEAVYDRETGVVTVRVLVDPGEKVPPILSFLVEEGDVLTRVDGARLVEVPVTEERLV
jgi:hypothetical protein